MEHLRGPGETNRKPYEDYSVSSHLTPAGQEDLDSPKFAINSQGQGTSANRERIWSFQNYEDNTPGISTQLTSAKPQPRPNTEYALTLKVKCETKFGETISVTGSIPELGRWKAYDFHLKWTKGHIWVSEQPIITKAPYFSYKYVKLFNGKMKHWEGGIDRIVDL